MNYRQIDRTTDRSLRNCEWKVERVLQPNYVRNDLRSRWWWVDSQSQYISLHSRLIADGWRWSCYSGLGLPIDHATNHVDEFVIMTILRWDETRHHTSENSHNHFSILHYIMQMIVVGVRLCESVTTGQTQQHWGTK